jgi:hypothetical protein
MNVQAATMQVDRWEARNRYLEYREAVRKHARTDPLGAGKTADAQLTHAYAAIARGEAVLDIEKALADAGVDEHHMPRLAVARAHWPFVRCYLYEGRVVFDFKDRSYSRKEETRIRRLVSSRIAGATGSTAGKAQVPVIPPRHRPAGHVSRYHILFEAVWQREPPDPDPLLLRHLGGPFFVVLAQWDLSPLEQAVLRARL